MDLSLHFEGCQTKNINEVELHSFGSFIIFLGFRPVDKWNSFLIKLPYYIVKTQSFSAHSFLSLCGKGLACVGSTQTHFSPGKPVTGGAASNISPRAFWLLLKGAKGSLSEALKPQDIH